MTSRRFPDPFRAWSFRSIVSLFVHGAQAAGSVENFLEAHPFLVGYIDEIAQAGFDGLTLDETLERLDRELSQASEASHHPLEVARERNLWSADTLTGWLWCGLTREDPRFGKVLEGLLGRDGLPGRATLSSWIDDSPSVGELIAQGWLEELDAGNDKVLRVPQALWEAARGRKPIEPGITYISRHNLSESTPIFPDEILERALEPLGRDQSIWILQGGPSSGRGTLARWIAQRSGSGLLEVAQSRSEQTWIGPLATMLSAIPLFSLEIPSGSRLPWNPPPGYTGSAIVRQTGSGTLECGFGACRLELGVPDRLERRSHWTSILGHPPSEALLALRIARGAIHSPLGSTVDSPDGIRRFRRELSDMGRHLLEGVARSMAPLAPTQRLELGPVATSEFAALVSRCRHRETLAETLPAAFGHGGAGVRALFKGPSGTGKTLAARHLATSLGMPLWRVDLSAVVSKWIGETEKNLERAFQAAESLDIVLLLDEGDALLANRTSVGSSTDRYANLETNFLLQRLESFEGVLIATTNAPERIDSAFLRRFDVVVEFPVPESPERLRLWNMHLPEGHQVPSARLEELARRCDLSGGHIRNAALHATLLSLEQKAALSDRQILESVRREYRRAGLSCPTFQEANP